MFKWREAYTAYVNMDHRKDRRDRMELTLTAAGIRAERVRGIPWQELYRPGTDNQVKLGKLERMYKRTPGAIGCHYSQVSIMKMALQQEKSAFVMEDDLALCQDLTKRLDIIQEFCNTHTWDVFWLGSTFHKEPQWHRRGHSSELLECKCDLNKDWEKTDNPRIVRAYGCWSTYAYLVNQHSLKNVLNLLDRYIHLSIGIDWLFILLSPHLQTYCFLPGSVKQYDNQSDIGKGITKFSQFASLGRYWYQDKMEQFEPTRF